jgi:hypothetical protein
MVYCTWKNNILRLFPSSNVSKNTTFQKLDLFPSSGKIMAARTLLGPLESLDQIQFPKRCVFRNIRQWKSPKHVSSTVINIWVHEKVDSLDQLSDC